MALTTVPETLQKVLNDANPGTGWDALRQMQLGTMLTPTVFDTGTISASATITLDPPALIVQSARIVASGTAGSVGSYMVTDAGGTPAAIVGGASTQPGVATISADGTTLTFANTVTQAVVVYMPRSATDMGTLEQPAS